MKTKKQSKKRLNIYKVWQEKLGGYDTYSVFVIVCEDETIAKSMHPSGHKLEYVTESNSWVINPNDAKCVLVGKAELGIEAGIICSSFHAC